MSTLVYDSSGSARSRSGGGGPGGSAKLVSAADSLPSADLGIDALRERMKRFQLKFNGYIDREKKRLLDDKEQFQATVAGLNKDQNQQVDMIRQVNERIASHHQMVEKERTEKQEILEAIRAVSAQRDANAAQRDALLEEISTVKAAISERTAAQRAHNQHLTQQARLNVPELDFWETHLGMRIEGAGVVDRLRFVFTHVSEADWDREAWFELATGARDYDVVTSEPVLDRADLERILDRLNGSRDLAPFLKGIRDLFVRTLK